MRCMRCSGSRGFGVVGAAVLAAAVVCSALAWAQTPPAPDSTTVGRVQQGAPQPTFRSGVTLVTTDVIVRDRDGVFMPDLTKEDFLVFEDEVEQEIASLVLVHGGRVYNQILPPPPAQEGIILPSSRPANDTAGRIFVLFIDDLHLVTSSTPRVRQVFKEIADTLVHEGDLFGIISTGPSSISIDMTYDRTQLYSAMERITGDGLSISDLVRGVGNAQSRAPQEIFYRAHVAFKTARNVLANLEQVTNRRKVFIYLSNGYDFNPFSESRRYNRGLSPGSARDAQLSRIENYSEADAFSGLPDPAQDPFGGSALEETRQGQLFADTDLTADLAELTRVANRANTSFYTFDPRGLLASPDIDENIPVHEWNTYIFKTQNTLRLLAELTGGMAVVNRNDFGDALRQIDAETSDYYIVGFYTSNPDPTIRTRRLNVEVVGRENEDIDIRSRSHYTLPRGPA